MSIGELRHRITLVELRITEDMYGNQTKEWVEVANLWAKASNLYGKVYFTAASIHLEKMVVFTIRYRAGLNEEMIIRFKGKQYNIQFIDNIKYRNEYLEIKAMLKV